MTRLRLAALLLLVAVAVLGLVDQVGARLEARGRGMVSDGRWEVAKGVVTLDKARVRAGGEQIAAGEKLAGVGRRMDVWPGW